MHNRGRNKSKLVLFACVPTQEQVLLVCAEYSSARRCATCVCAKFNSARTCCALYVCWIQQCKKDLVTIFILLIWKWKIFILSKPALHRCSCQGYNKNEFSKRMNIMLELISARPFGVGWGPSRASETTGPLVYLQYQYAAVYMTLHYMLRERKKNNAACWHSTSMPARLRAWDPPPVRVVNMPVPARAAGKQAASKAKPVIKAATA